VSKAIQAIFESGQLPAVPVFVPTVDLTDLVRRVMWEDEVSMNSIAAILQQLGLTHHRAVKRSGFEFGDIGDVRLAAEEKLFGEFDWAPTDGWKPLTDVNLIREIYRRLS